jgi:hypothetical protein
MATSRTPEPEQRVIIFYPFKGRAVRTVTQFVHLSIEASENARHIKQRPSERKRSKTGILHTTFLVDAAADGDFDDGE